MSDSRLGVAEGGLEDWQFPNPLILAADTLTNISTPEDNPLITKERSLRSRIICSPSTTSKFRALLQDTENTKLLRILEKFTQIELIC